MICRDEHRFNLVNLSCGGFVVNTTTIMEELLGSRLSDDEFAQCIPSKFLLVEVFCRGEVKS